jgi:hypothetical protein
MLRVKANKFPNAKKKVSTSLTCFLIKEIDFNHEFKISLILDLLVSTRVNQ